MADESGETRCKRLELSDGSKVYLQSVWETTNFSIVVFDGVQAWSHSVASKEVVNIATAWNIDVGDFMRSARARLCGQHPTSTYSMSPADKGAVNLAFTIDDLCEGKALDLRLRLDGISDVRPIVREILDHLLDTNDKLKEQLTEAKSQFQTAQKILPETAPKLEPPSITLTLSRSNPNYQPRRQTTSPFMEPRLLDFSHGRDTPSTPRQQPHNQHLLRDTLENCIISTSQPPSTSFNSSITKPANASTPLQTDISREPGKLQSPAKSGYCKSLARNNILSDLTVNMVALTPDILRVLNSLSNGIQDLERESNMVEKPESDSGLKITEMRSPGCEAAGRAEVENECKKREGMIWSGGFSAGMKKREENCDGGNGHVVLEKSGSNGEGKESGGSDEERTTGLKVTLEDSDFRANAGAPESTRAQGKSSTDEKREKSQLSDHTQFTTPNTQHPRSNDPGRRQESLAETIARKRSPVTRESQFWENNNNTTNNSMDGNIDGIIDRIGDGFAVRTRSGSKREKKLQVSYAETEDEDDGRKKKSSYSSRSPSAGGQNSSRKRTIQERLDEMLQSHKHGKLEVDSSDNKGTEGTTNTRETPRKIITRNSIDKNIKQEAMNLDEYPEYNKTKRDRESNRERSPERGRESERFPKKAPAAAADGAPSNPRPRTISDLLQGKNPGNDNNGIDRRKGCLKTTRNGKRAASAPGGENTAKRQSRGSAGGSSDRETSGSRDRVVTSVPDPDYYDFDKDRTEHAFEAHQVWAVYDDKDAMPRTYARINKISNSSKFSASVTWLKPHHPSDKAKQRSEKNYTAPACGEFEYADNETTLTEINCFSHKMACTPVSPTVGKIFPRKGEVWALYKITKTPYITTTTPSSDGDDDDDDDDETTPEPQFRLAEILEDVEAGEEPEIQVLGRVPGFRTIWKAVYEKGRMPATDLSRFSHRVPAYKLEGNEVPRVLKGSWDIDPAGMPLTDSRGGI